MDSRSDWKKKAEDYFLDHVTPYVLGGDEKDAMDPFLGSVDIC